MLLPLQNVPVSALGRDLHERSFEKLSLALQNWTKEGGVRGKFGATYFHFLFPFMNPKHWLQPWVMFNLIHRKI